jgi:hypothetical protein
LIHIFAPIHSHASLLGVHVPANHRFVARLFVRNLCVSLHRFVKASGAVGNAAIQIAHWKGASVVGADIAGGPTDGLGLRDVQKAGLKAFPQMVHHASNFRASELLRIDPDQMELVAVEAGQIQMNLAIRTGFVC